jgi:hypothetical protein
MSFTISSSHPGRINAKLETVPNRYNEILCR